jgi:3-hydroxyisobutyrate dehydrogenase
MGNMGLSMASNLLKKGFEVKGYDISEASLRKAENLGIKPSTTIKDVSTEVDYIVTSLPKTQDVEAILTEDGGVFSSASPNTMIVDSSTISPIAAKEFSEEAKKHRMIYCDSPMSGGVVGAANGTLTFMVGATSTEEFEHAKIVLSGMGQRIFHCGQPGSGETAKIANNLILGIQMVASSEGMALAEKLGIDPKVLMEILSVSTANNWCINTNNPRPGNKENAPASKNYEGGFQVALMRKDLALALECAKAVGQKTEYTEKTLDIYRHLEKKGHGGKDFGYVFQFMMKNHQI